MDRMDHHRPPSELENEAHLGVGVYVHSVRTCITYLLYVQCTYVDNLNPSMHEEGVKSPRR